MIILLASLGHASSAVAQPDSTRQAILRARGLPIDHTPERALWRAIMVPGWGQFYNRQYYKMPFVYAGLVGFVAAVFYTNDRYRLYGHAYLYRAYQDEPGGNPFTDYEEEYTLLRDRFGGDFKAGELKKQRDKYRRYRDLSVVGLGLYYALSVLDAYVSAHLLTFDVGEDLTMRVQPTSQGVTTQLRWRF